MKLAHTVYEPKGPGPHPTIFALHGYGSNSLDLLGLAPHLAGGRFLVIAPQGPDEVALDLPMSGGAKGYGWFPLTIANPPTPLSVAEGVGVARDFVDEACARYPVDPGRLVALGFSQGGVIAYALALADPARWKALVALSSWLSDDLVKVLPQCDRRGLQAWVQHGTSDEVITVARGRASAERLRELGVAPTYREYDMGHEVSPRSLTELSRWLDENI
jgi:phospholipase/carboxylesterase